MHIVLVQRKQKKLMDEGTEKMERRKKIEWREKKGVKVVLTSLLVEPVSFRTV
jgi:hypothetical protein